MSHPYASQAKASEKARLKRLGATAGKSFGSSSMYKASSYPSKGAGTQREYTIPGGGAKRRPDRLASGGLVSGGNKKKRRSGNTTNIIISHAGGRGGSGGGGGAGPNPMPVPVPRPVPVPVGGAGPAPAGGPAPVPVRPMIAGGGGPPPGPPGPPPGPPGLGPPRPPGMPPGMKAGGVVRKAANGGFLKEGEPKGYKGFPHSPTTSVDSAVSAHKKGGAIKRADGGGVSEEDTSVQGAAGPDGPPGASGGIAGGGLAKGGAVKKRQMGGGLGGPLGGGPSALAAGAGDRVAGGVSGILGNIPGRHPLPAQKGTPTISNVNARPPQPVTVPMPASFGSFASRPAPGTTTTFAKRGGAIGKKDGGRLTAAQRQSLPRSDFALPGKGEGPKGAGSGSYPINDRSHAQNALARSSGKPEAAAVRRKVMAKYPDMGRKRGGAVHDDEAEDRKLFKKMIKQEDKAEKRARGGVVNPGMPNKARGLSGSTYHQQGKGFADGGIVNSTGGAGGGKGRLAMTRRAKSVPDKTEA